MVTTDGNIRSVRIEEEMRTSYLSYAMSVIVSRALPDVRDGLKTGPASDTLCDAGVGPQRHQPTKEVRPHRR